MSTNDNTAVAMNPWLPERDPVICRRVGKTGEEASELLKIISRIQIQGIDGVDPKDQKPNRQALMEEVADVIAQCRLCCTFFGFDSAKVEARIAHKLKLMDEWEALVAPVVEVQFCHDLQDGWYEATFPDASLNGAYRQHITIEAIAARAEWPIRWIGEETYNPWRRPKPSPSQGTEP